jgi:hypothetical protein
VQACECVLSCPRSFIFMDNEPLLGSGNGLHQLWADAWCSWSVLGLRTGIWGMDLLGSSWSWYAIFLMCYWIWFASILLRIFGSMFTEVIDL